MRYRGMSISSGDRSLAGEPVGDHRERPVGRGSGTSVHTRQRRGGRPVLPARRQRWVRRHALRPRPDVQPRDAAPDRDGDHRGAGHPEPVPVQLRLRPAALQSIRVGGTASHVDASLGRARRHAEPRDPVRAELHDRRDVSGTADASSRTPASAPWALFTPTTAPSWSASRTWPRSGSRPTTTPPTRPRSPSTSPCPQGLEAVSNGRLASRPTHAGWTTWNWIASEPMATYLATTAIGHFDIHRYRPTA